VTIRYFCHLSRETGFVCRHMYLKSQPSVKGRAISTIPVLRCSASVRNAWVVRGCAMRCRSPAAQDESDFGRNCPLARTRRSALSSWLLAGSLLLPKHLCHPRSFALCPLLRFFLVPRANQPSPAAARREFYFYQWHPESRETVQGKDIKMMNRSGRRRCEQESVLSIVLHTKSGSMVSSIVRWQAGKISFH
jgi:hypothetical protein